MDGAWHGPGDEIRVYYAPWWLEHTRPGNQGYVTHRTINEALEFHRRQAKDIPAQPFVLNRPAYSWKSEAHTASGIDCTRCRLYRAVALGAIDQLADLRNLTNALESAYQCERDLGIRWVAGFHQLFEAAVIKELDVGSDSSPAGRMSGLAGFGRLDQAASGSGSRGKRDKKKGKKAEDPEVLRKRAEALKLYWETAPQVRWVWGVDISHSDIEGMVRGVDRSYKVPHSGYGQSLVTGNLSYSNRESLSDIEDDDDEIIFFEALSDDFPNVRELTVEEILLAFALPPSVFLRRNVADNFVADPYSQPASGGYVRAPIPDAFTVPAVQWAPMSSPATSAADTSNPVGFSPVYVPSDDEPMDMSEVSVGGLIYSC